MDGQHPDVSEDAQVFQPLIDAVNSLIDAHKSMADEITSLKERMECLERDGGEMYTEWYNKREADKKSKYMDRINGYMTEGDKQYTDMWPKVFGKDLIDNIYEEILNAEKDLEKAKEALDEQYFDEEGGINVESVVNAYRGHAKKVFDNLYPSDKPEGAAIEVEIEKPSEPEEPVDEKQAEYKRIAETAKKRRI